MTGPPPDATRSPGDRAWMLAAAGLGALAFAYAVPVRVVDPRNVRWMMKADRSAQLMGWLFFRNDPWRLPLGAIHSMVFPLTTTVGYSDALPWLAVPAKFLLAGVSGPFQFNGAFLLACYILQGLFGYLLLRGVGARRSLALAGAGFFAYSPILLERFEHISLCAQWLVLAAWCLYFRPATAGRTRRRLALWLLLVAVSIPTYVYLAVMVIVIAAADYVRAVRNDRALTPRAAALHGAAIAGLVVLSLWGWGYLTVRHVGDPGFGIYSADLLAFLDPGPWSTYLKPLASIHRNYETFDYLGAGMVAILIACLALAVAKSGSAASSVGRSPRRAALGPAIAAAVVLWVYALATPIRFGGHDLVYIGLYAPLHWLTSAFRGSARFLWPAYYLAMALALAELGRRLTPRGAVGVALAAFALQIADLRDLRRALRADYLYPWATLESPLWQGIGRDYRALRLVPPVIAHRTACARYGGSEDYEIKFAAVAARERMLFNSAALARADELGPLCKPMIDSLRQGLVDPATVYVPNGAFLQAMRWWTDHRLVCGSIDSANVCVARAGPSRLAAWLRAHEPAAEPRVLDVPLARPGLPPALDSAPGFASPGPRGRLIPNSGPPAKLVFARPLGGPVAVRVEASASGATHPWPLSVSLGTETRTVLVDSAGTAVTVFFPGDSTSAVLEFRAGRDAPAALASSADTTGIRVAAVTIEAKGDH